MEGDSHLPATVTPGLGSHGLDRSNDRFRQRWRLARRPWVLSPKADKGTANADKGGGRRPACLFESTGHGGRCLRAPAAASLGARAPPVVGCVNGRDTERILL